MTRQRRPLVPGARDGLDLLKAQVGRVSEPNQAKYNAAARLNIPLKPGYNGDLTAHDAGRIGGQLGGQMVKELIRQAQAKLARQQHP